MVGHRSCHPIVSPESPREFLHSKKVRCRAKLENHIILTSEVLPKIYGYFLEYNTSTRKYMIMTRCKDAETEYSSID